MLDPRLGRLAEGFKRLGIAFGIVCATVAIVIGGSSVWQAAQVHGWLHSITLLRIVYTAGATYFAFCISLLMGELGYWVAEGFATGRPTGPMAKRDVRMFLIALGVFPIMGVASVAGHDLAIAIFERWPESTQAIAQKVGVVGLIRSHFGQETAETIYREAIALPVGLITGLAGLLLYIWLMVKTRLLDTSRR